jgi:uncharacterized protein (UPF0332 family)
VKRGKPELLAWRLRRAEESFQMIEISVNQEYWNSAATHLYYTCFYLIRALFVERELEVKHTAA